MSKHPQIGSSLESLFEELGELEEMEAVAAKKIFAYELEEAMKAENVSKRALAKIMQTSRAAVTRILDPGNKGITLDSMTKASAALGREIVITIRKRPAISGRASLTALRPPMMATMKAKKAKAKKALNATVIR